MNEDLQCLIAYSLIASSKVYPKILSAAAGETVLVKALVKDVSSFLSARIA